MGLKKTFFGGENNLGQNIFKVQNLQGVKIFWVYKIRFGVWGRLKGATVATFYTQKGATVASFYTQKVATLCFGDYVYEARQDNLHPVIVA